MELDLNKSHFSSALDGLVEELQSQGTLRVWSIIITIFGDVVYTRGETISAVTLNQITERLHVSHGTLRVALSRLAAEDWIDRTRKGRNSFYSLTSTGSEAFGPAAKLVYAAGLPEDDGQYLFIHLPVAGSGYRAKVEQQLRDQQLVELAGGLYLSPQVETIKKLDREVEGFDHCVVVEGSLAQLPETVRSAMLPAGLAEEYTDLTGRLEKLETAFDEAPEKTAGLDAVAARVLVIHLWRRLILQQANLPSALLPDKWPGENCRLRVRSLYLKLLPASQQWLNEAFASHEGEAESAEALMALRFV